jgi:hypothetical protein
VLWSPYLITDNQRCHVIRVNHNAALESHRWQFVILYETPNGFCRDIT